MIKCKNTDHRDYSQRTHSIKQHKWLLFFSLCSLVVGLMRKMLWWVYFFITVDSCTPVGGCRVRFLMCWSCCTFCKRKLQMRMVGRLLALSAFYIFPLQLDSLSVSVFGLAVLSEECQQLCSEASCCHDWRSIHTWTNCLFGLSLQRFLWAPWSHFSSWTSLKRMAFSMHVCLPSLRHGQVKCSRTKEMNDSVSRDAIYITLQAQQIFHIAFTKGAATSHEGDSTLVSSLQAWNVD